YNINSMPVMEKGEIIGLVNRQVLEKAMFHGLENQTAREFMHSDFATVRPESTLIEIQTNLVEQNQRILPVVEDGKVIGVITRRDLLNFLVSDHFNTPQALLDDQPLTHWSKRKHLASVLAEQLPRDMVRRLRSFGELAERLNFLAYAVGGFVRDLMLRRQNFDIDIVVEGDGIEFAKTYAEENGIKVRCHRKFNTAVLIFPDGQKVDVASARFEYYQYPAALPIVEFSSLKMDLYRRDFTINTLALALNPDEFGQLIDFFNGQRDLKERTVRVLHNLSFVEDPTRIMRAIRFEQRFGFRIAKQTAMLMRNALRIGLIQKLGGRRFLHEIQLILMEDDPIPSIKRMDEFGVLAVLSPSMHFDARMEALFGRLREVISWSKLSFLEEAIDRWWVYLLGLLSGLSREELRDTFDRLQLIHTQADRIVWTYERTGELLRTFFQLPEHRPSDIYRALQPFSPEELLFMMGKTQSEEIRRAVSRYFHRYRHVRSEIKGRDLVAMGFSPGRIFRTILDEILDARLNGEIKDRNDELEYIRSHYPQYIKNKKTPPAPAS
ncbi:MAG: CBS domain-containing protein, partial [Acidobacteriota bacterium]